MTEAVESHRPRFMVEMDKLEGDREDRLTTLRAELAEIEETDSLLRAQRAEIDRRIQENGARRERVGEAIRELPVDTERRAHAVMLASLQEDRSLVDARAQALAETAEMANLELQRRLQDPEIASSLEEYEKFAEVEPVLGSLPPSYRQVVLEHHTALKELLQPIFELSAGASKDLEVDAATVALVASVDPKDESGAPAAFAIHLPVPFAVHKDWADNQEDLSALLAYRVMGGISRALEEAGAAGAPVLYRPLADFLAIQVWLGDHDVGAGFKDLVEARIKESTGDARELGMARLAVQLAWVEPAVVAPDGLEDESGAASENPGASGPADKGVQILLRRGGNDDW